MILSYDKKERLMFHPENEIAELNKRDLDAIDKEIAFHEKRIHVLNEERREFINRNNLNKGKNDATD